MDLISPYRLLCVALILYGRVLCNEHVPKYDAHDEPPKYGDTLATSGYLGPARDVGYIGHGPQNNGWLRSSYQDEEIKHMSLPKKVFKNYVSAKDRLFFNYLGTYTMLFYAHMFSKLKKAESSQNSKKSYFLNLLKFCFSYIINVLKEHA